MRNTIILFIIGWILASISSNDFMFNGLVGFIGVALVIITGVCLYKGDRTFEDISA